MIKSIFFRALTLLGLTFVLIGCGAADPGEGGTGTPGTGTSSTPAGVSMEDVTKKVEKLIRDSKGKVDLADGQAVATKFVSIMKASQPMGSCSLFNQTIFPGYDETTAAVKSTYVANGNIYPGGEGKLTVELDKKGAAGIITKDTDKIIYKYDKYSIDGIYFLDGALKMKAGTSTVATTPGVSDFTAEASTLKLSMSGVDGAEAKDIAKINFATTFKPVFTAVASNVCGSDNFAQATMAANSVTIEKEGTSTFEKVSMSITTAGSATDGKQVGTNVGLLMSLIGPRNS